MLSRILVTAFALTLLSTPAMAKDIDWSGYTWHVRDGGGGPGPNNWSAQNAWVDERRQLHLKIAKRDGEWSCAELTMSQPLGFGKYDFTVVGPAEKMDDNIVLGLFNYPTPDIGGDGTNEIDIEFATWGGVQKMHGNWTVWPAKAGIKQGSHIFDVSKASGSLSTPRTPFMVLGNSRSSFEWTAKSVKYHWAPLVMGCGWTETSPEDWTYQPENSADAIPQHPLPVHINLWLFNGKPPTDDKEVEIIVSAFRFTPQAKAN